MPPLRRGTRGVVTSVTTPTPSAMLPPAPTPGAMRDQRITKAIEQADAEARMCASADFINGSRPSSRAEAELIVVRNQRDHALARIEDLHAELTPMVLAMRFFGALLTQTCGGEARLSDEDLDAFVLARGDTGVEFTRNETGDGWVVRPSRPDTAGRQA